MLLRFLGIVSLLFVAITPLVGQEAEASRNTVLRAGEVYTGDYFVCGSSVEISGVVRGDVYAIGGQVVIDGMIDGDLLVLGGSVDVSGEVKENVRMIGGQLLVSGRVGENITALAANIQVLPCARVGRNFVAAAGTIDLAAQVGGDGTVAASYLRAASSIEQNLRAYVGNLRLTSRAVIGGDLSYQSNEPAAIEEGARVRGEIAYTPSLVQGWLKGTWFNKILLGSKVLASTMNFLYSFVIGLILIRVFPDNLENTVHQLKHRPWKALSFGLILLVALPLASLILLMTVLGVPFALTLIAANIIGFYTAKIYTIYWGAHLLFKKLRLHTRKILTLIGGLVLYFPLTAIPFVGPVVAFAAMLLGVGAGVLAQSHQRKKAL